MTVPIIRYHYPSTSKCLLSAAAVVMSARLPTHQKADGSWTGDLPPDLIIKNYERQFGPVPSYGADPQKVWSLCESAYGLKAFAPAYPFGWDLDFAQKLLDLNVPLMVCYYTSWDWDGNGLASHCATLYGMADGRLAIWDQDRGVEMAWSEDQFWNYWVWRDGSWHAYPRFNGWFIALCPPDWGAPETW